MANVVTIEAEARARAGKGAARATRREGKVPGVIYGAKQEPSLIALDPRAVLRELHRPGWQSRRYEIRINGDATQALIRDVQFHPVSDAPEHVDFQRLVPGVRVRVSVPVHFENDGLSPGLKRGGVLNVIRHTVEVYTQPEHIPEQFTADLANLDFNDAVRWEDLKGAENTHSIIDRNFVVATVAPPTKQTEVAAEPTAAASPAPAATAAAPAAAASARGGAGGARGGGSKRG
ncbi:MAG TPA: 50S ribosomal protein L25/general stress protein Ctc [Acetobacteraceae bacterium]|jgi:large subunit ribosomal protein L25